jgi:Ca2+-dependent lipid-binding protein
MATGDSNVNVAVWDFDAVGSDDLIGSTTVELSQVFADSLD